MKVPVTGAVTVHYRLRPDCARYQPAFRLDELYPFLREDALPGYIFLELLGKPRCVEAKHFEKVDA